MTEKPKTEAATAEAKPKEPSFWKTLPGILTGLAALVTATAGLVAALTAAGVIGSKAPAPVASSGGGTSSETPSISTEGDNSPVVSGAEGNVTIEIDN